MSDFWLRSIGDNEYVASVHAQTTRQKLLTDVKTNVKKVLAVTVESGRRLICPNGEESTALCSSVEAIFTHGIRAKILGRNIPCSFWNYIEQLRKLYPISASGFEVIMSLSEVQTDEGRGRAWLRRALNESELHTHLEILITNQEVTRLFYEEQAFLAQPEDPHIFLALIMTLNNVSFELDFNERSLDQQQDAKVVKPTAVKVKKKKKVVKRKATIIDLNAGSPSNDDDRPESPRPVSPRPESPAPESPRYGSPLVDSPLPLSPLAPSPIQANETAKQSSPIPISTPSASMNGGGEGSPHPSITIPPPSPSRASAEEEKRKREEEERQTRENEQRLKREEEYRMELEEDERAKHQEEERIKREEEDRLKQLEELRKQEELRRAEEERIRHEEVGRIKREEEDRLKREEEARIKCLEEERLRFEEEQRQRRQEEERIRREEEERFQRQEAERLQREEQERLRLQRETEEKLKREEEERQRLAELERLKRLEAERIQREEDERLKRIEEDRITREEEERARLEMLKQEQEQERQRQEELTRLKREEEERFRLAEEARVKREEEERFRLEEDARLTRETEAKLKLEEEEKTRIELERQRLASQQLRQEEDQRREKAEKLRLAEAERVLLEERTRPKLEEEQKALREEVEKARLEELQRNKEKEDSLRLRQEEEERLKREEEANQNRLAEENKRKQQEENERIKREKAYKWFQEEKAKREETLRKQREEEERIRQLEAEKVEAERQKHEQERAEREAVLRAQEEDKASIAAELRKQQQEEEAALFEAQRKKLEEEAAQKKRDKEYRRQQQEAAAQYLREEEQRRKQQAEEEARKKIEEEKQAKSQEEEAALRRLQEYSRREAERIRKEEEEQIKRDEENRKRKEEVARLKQNASSPPKETAAVRVNSKLIERVNSANSANTQKLLSYAHSPGGEVDTEGNEHSDLPVPVEYSANQYMDALEALSERVRKDALSKKEEEEAVTDLTRSFVDNYVGVATDDDDYGGLEYISARVAMAAPIPLDYIEPETVSNIEKDFVMAGVLEKFKSSELVNSLTAAPSTASIGAYSEKWYFDLFQHNTKYKPAKLNDPLTPVRKASVSNKTAKNANGTPIPTTKNSLTTNNNQTATQQPTATSTKETITTEWTPPRNKLYFNIHTNATTKDQNFMCHGCGHALSQGGFGLFSTIRYCEYTGKFYCGQCHKRDTFFIPARILHNWDHRMLPVSVASKKFLHDIYRDPLFDVSAINPKLYTQSKTLPRIKRLRQQLKFLKDFILTCRDRDKGGLVLPLQEKMYLATDLHTYSLCDLVESHQLLEWCRELVERYVLHVQKCAVCKMRGSVCEFCKKPDLIYPFQLQATIQCVGPCKGIYHRGCYVKEKCPKCLRITKRKLFADGVIPLAADAIPTNAPQPTK